MGTDEGALRKATLREQLTARRKALSAELVLDGDPPILLPGHDGGLMEAYVFSRVELLETSERFIRVGLLWE